MKTLIRSIILTPFFVLAFLISATTGVAQETDSGYKSDKRHQQREGRQRGMQAAPEIERLKRALHRLELSDEQKENIQAITQTMKEDIRPIMADMKAGQQELKALIMADEFDENAVAELAATEGALTSERILITSRTVSSVLGQLTDEQRAQLQEMGTERRQRNQDKRQQREAEG